MTFLKTNLWIPAKASHSGKPIGSPHLAFIFIALLGQMQYTNQVIFTVSSDFNNNNWHPLLLGFHGVEMRKLTPGQICPQKRRECFVCPLFTDMPHVLVHEIENRFDFRFQPSLMKAFCTCPLLDRLHTFLLDIYQVVGLLSQWVCLFSILVGDRQLIPNVIVHKRESSCYSVSSSISGFAVFFKCQSFWWMCNILNVSSRSLWFSLGFLYL